MQWLEELHLSVPRHWLFSVLKSLFNTLRPFKRSLAWRLWWCKAMTGWGVVELGCVSLVCWKNGDWRGLVAGISQVAAISSTFESITVPLVQWDRLRSLNFVNDIFSYNLLLCNCIIKSLCSSPPLLYDMIKDGWVCSLQNVFSIWKSPRLGNPSPLHIKI